MTQSSQATAEAHERTSEWGKKLANLDVFHKSSSAEGPREGPGVARMPVAAKTSSKRLGVHEQGSPCPWPRGLFPAPSVFHFWGFLLLLN